MLAPGSVEISGRELLDERAQDLAQGQRADREVGAAQAEGGRPDQQGQGDGHRAPAAIASQDGRARDPEGARGQRAQAEEGGVAQVHLARVARDDVPALGHRDREQDEQHEVQHVVAAGEERQRRERGERHQDRHRPPPLAGHRDSRPNRPCGRSTSTTTKITRPTTSRYGPPNAAALSASATPTKRPAAKVPSMDPRPASTTTIRALSVHSSPIAGLIE